MVCHTCLLPVPVSLTVTLLTPVVCESTDPTIFSDDPSPPSNLIEDDDLAPPPDAGLSTMYSLSENPDPYAESLARALQNADLSNSEDERPACEKEHSPNWKTEDPFFCTGELIAP